MKRKSILWIITAIIPCVLTLLIACVKELEEEGIFTETRIIGTVVEKSTMQPIKGVIVSVTDGTHVHASTSTDSRGAFTLADINFEECEKDYYLWLDGSQLDLPSKQEVLKGVGQEVYDYKTLVLYDKTNVELLPSVNTVEITDVTALSAKVSGNVVSDGNHEVFERGVCVATQQVPTLKDSVFTSGRGLGTYSCSISGLTKSTSYYVRAYAINSIDTVYGAQLSFQTRSGESGITTKPATDIKSNRATMNGEVVNDGGAPITARGFCWSTSENPTTTDSCTSDGAGTGSFSHTLQSLESNTTYYYRAYAINECCTTLGTQRSFTTTSGLPTLTTVAATNITATSAKCGGNITDNGGFEVTARGICWNTTGNPDLNDNHKASGTGNGSFTCNMSNLTAGTTYHVRAYATNSRGTNYGNEVTFTALSGNITLTTNDISDITATSAKGGGNITDNGGFEVTTRGICWNTTGNPDINESHKANGTGNGSFTCSMTGLDVNTTYYVRAYATNEMGTYYGEQKNFTTADGLAVVTASNVTNITATSAVCGGSITSNGGFPVSDKGLVWSTYANPTLSDNHLSLGNGEASFSGTMTGLSMGTTYYVRAYATNSHGTAYSSQRTFTTGSGLPTVTTTAVTTSGSQYISGGNVTSDGGYSVTARGICYGIYPNPDLSDSYSHTENGTGTGYFTSIINNSSTGTIYVRAYATNVNGTVYGNEIVMNTYYLSLPVFTYNGHTYRVAPNANNKLNWDDANTYCNNLTLYGYSDWRMPTKSELLQMYNDRNSIGSFYTQNYGYWSSTVSSTGVHYAVYFDDGSVSGRPNSYTEYVRPIRVEN